MSFQSTGYIYNYFLHKETQINKCMQAKYKESSNSFEEIIYIVYAAIWGVHSSKSTHLFLS